MLNRGWTREGEALERYMLKRRMSPCCDLRNLVVEC